MNVSLSRCFSINHLLVLILAFPGNNGGDKMSRATADGHATIGYESGSVGMSHLERVRALVLQATLLTLPV